MTQAFNLSQLANNVNTSGQLSASAGVSGTLPVANGGTGRTTNTAFAVICGGTTAGGAEQSIASVGTSGQVLTSNGAGALPTFQNAAAGGGGFSNMQVFTSSGTFTVPAGITKVKATVIGGGGGGGAFDGTGGTGGTSSFGSFCSATGGTGGGPANSGQVPGVGGSGSGGNINFTGGRATWFGIAGASALGFGPSCGQGGVNGILYGGGGAGNGDNCNGFSGGGGGGGGTIEIISGLTPGGTVSVTIGGGGGGSGTGGNPGGSGAAGVVIVEW